MALKGTLKDFGIADILQLIGQQQKTGTLHLTGRDQEVSVGFKDGAIVRAESTTRKKKELIGNMLVRAELITEQQLESALETQRRTLKRLGDVLVANRMVTKERFRDIVQLQTTETLYKLFGWKSGTYEFVQGEIEFDPATDLQMRAESILMEGFRRVDEWPTIKKTLTSNELAFERLQALPPPPPPSASTGMDEFDLGDDSKDGVGPNERKVYQLVAPGEDVRRLIDLSCLGEFETCKALLNLVNLGYLRVVAPGGQTHSVGGAPSRLDSITAPLWRIAMTVLVLAALGLIVPRLGAGGLELSGSPGSFADPAAQRVISRAQLARIEAALRVYRLEKGDVPEKLDALVAAGLLKGQDLRYPWRETYHYRRTAEGGFILLPPLR
jgi:Domain of unknown function (DUF4388)